MSDENGVGIFNSVDSIADNNWADGYGDYPLPFSSVLAHNVKNPLTSIGLAVDLLESVLIDDTQKIYLSFIKKSYFRIDSLMNLLLTQQPNNHIPAKECPIHEFLDDIIEVLSESIMLENISVSKDYNKEEFTVIINEAKMKIALINIITNSIDAMNTKKGILKLSTKITDGKYTIQIEDNGCGIKKEQLKYIFQPSYSSKSNRLGMGLALTYDILKCNNVGLSIQSKKGKGTCFMLSFDKVVKR